MAARVITHNELDAMLEPVATEPDRFDRLAESVIEELDAEGADLEIRDPALWREGGPAPTQAAGRTTFLNQFRSDVESIATMERDEEAQLARRIELARMRLRKARRDADLDEGEGRLGFELDESEFVDLSAQLEEMGLLPEDVARRARELHAMRSEMVERNLYLVLINVERYVHTGASRVDLIQEGCVSLFRAVDGFDWRRGLLFRTYAVHWLNQAFRNYLYNFSNTVRVPVYLQKALKHINQAQIHLGNPNASVGEIARTADMAESLVSSALAAARASYSIDAGSSSDDEGSTRLRDVLVFEEEDGPYSTRLEKVSLEEGLTRALDKLSERECRVLQLRFGVGEKREHTLAEVAEELGVSVERVRQIQVRALAKLNTPGLRRELDPWLN